jgi:hypothetical protein
MRHRPVYPFCRPVKVPRDCESAAYVITCSQQFLQRKFQGIRQRVAAQSLCHDAQDLRQHLNGVHIFSENLIGLWLTCARRSFLLGPAVFEIEAADDNFIFGQRIRMAVRHRTSRIFLQPREPMFLNTQPSEARLIAARFSAPARWPEFAAALSRIRFHPHLLRRSTIEREGA